MAPIPCNLIRRALPAALSLCTLLAAALPALSQQASPPSAASSAPAPGAGPRQGMGPGGGMGHGMSGWRMNRDNTPGWSMMTPAERAEHHRTMMSMTDKAQCRAYMDQHHAQMVDRAKERGRTAPGLPRHDPCTRLPG